MKIDIIILGICFVGVTILVIGSINKEQGKEKNEVQDTSNILAWIALFLIPFSAAINAINQRQMRELNDYTVGSYLTFAMVIVYLPIVLLQD